MSLELSKQCLRIIPVDSERQTHTVEVIYFPIQSASQRGEWQYVIVIEQGHGDRTN